MTELAKPDQARLTLRSMLERHRPEFRKALPPYLDPERMIRVALTAVNRQPDLLRCRPESVVQAVLQLSEWGLMPDGDEAYIIPYKDIARAQRGYRGLIKLAHEADESLAVIVAETVHKKDAFEFARTAEGDTLRHTPAEGEPGPVRGAYCIVRFKDGGTPKVTWLPVWRIENEHRRFSVAKAGDAWTNHYPAMCRKTAIIVGLNDVPKNPRLAKALIEERREEAPELPAPDLDLPEETAPPKGKAPAAAKTRLAAALQPPGDAPVERQPGDDVS